MTSTIGPVAPHLLDNAIWHALLTTQASFAVGDALAKRFPTQVSPLVGIREPSPEAFESLARTLGPGGVGALIVASPTAVPASWTLLHGLQLAQMVCTAPVKVETQCTIDRLADSEITEMVALAEMTKPGPLRGAHLNLAIISGSTRPTG